MVFLVKYSNVVCYISFFSFALLFIWYFYWETIRICRNWSILSHTLYILLHIWGWLDSFCLEDSNSHLGPQIWLNSIMGGIASILTAMFFLPIFYKMHATCLHEYFEHRLSLFRLQMQLIQFIEFTFSLF